MNCVRLLLGIALVSVLGCGEGVDRLDGEGCQPACSMIAAEDESPVDTFSVCLDEDESPDSCVIAGEDVAICATGSVVCGNGLPSCADGSRPTCGR